MFENGKSFILSIMKTILKFPIYVEIDSDNVDRKRVSDAAHEILYPELLKYISSAKVRRDILERMTVNARLTNLDIRFLTEIDLMKNSIRNV